MSDILVLIVVCVAISLIAKIWVKIAWAYYASCYPSVGDMNGEQTVKDILNNASAYSKCIVNVQEKSNYFDYRRNEIVLTPDVIEGTSILSIAISAHEAAHALQFLNGQQFAAKLKSISNSTNIFVIVSVIAIVLALLINTSIWIAVAAVCVIVALLTRIALLPIEYGASKRALFELSELGGYTDNDLRKINRMLHACAFTYVASVFDVLLLIIILTLAILGSGKKNKYK